MLPWACHRRANDGNLMSFQLGAPIGMQSRVGSVTPLTSAPMLPTMQMSIWSPLLLPLLLLL